MELRTRGQALAAAFAGTFIAVTAAGCHRNSQTSPAAAKAENRREQAACASPAAYDRLKNAMFDEAIAKGSPDRANLDTLADYSVVRMENPVVMSFDRSSEITRCKGRFVLEVPPGAQAGLGGERQLEADIAYSAQPSADGAGLVYQQSGAEPIIAKLAAFRLSAAAYRPPPAIDEATQPALTPEAQVPPAAAQPTAAAPAPVSRPASPAPRPERPRVAQGAVSTATQRPVALAERAPSIVPHPGRAQGAGVEGASTVRSFYGALANGNGAAASAQVIPEKRSSGPFSPAAISRFYGHLAAPVRLTGVSPSGQGAYRVTYRYSAGRSHCDGVAIVRVRSQDGRELISSIRSLTGC